AHGHCTATPSPSSSPVRFSAQRHTRLCAVIVCADVPSVPVHPKKNPCDNLDIASGQGQNFCTCRKSPNRARQTPIRRGRHVMSISKRQLTTPADSMTPVAGNGLLDRRALLGRGIVFAGAAAASVGTSITGAAAEPLKDDPWSLVMGEPTPPRQAPSRFEK